MTTIADAWLEGYAQSGADMPRCAAPCGDCDDCDEPITACPYPETAKRLTPPELAAEYHAQLAYNTYWEHRTTTPHYHRLKDIAETLHRFATTPHYDEP